MTISADSVVVRSDQPISAEVDAEIVILSAKAGAYFGLGEIGSEIWKRMGTPRRISDICMELVEQYDVEPQTCERDTLAFMTQLLADDLIRIVDGGNPRS